MATPAEAPAGVQAESSPIAQPKTTLRPQCSKEIYGLQLADEGLFDRQRRDGQRRRARVAGRQGPSSKSAT